MNDKKWSFEDKRLIKFYLGYLLIQWFIHLLIISINTYFHLSLKHGVSVLSDWIQDFSWYVVLATKAIALIFLFQYFKLKSKNIHFMNVFLQKYWRKPDYQTLAMFLFVWLAIFFMAKPVWNESFLFHPFRFILSGLGVFVFYFSDILILLIHDYLFPIKDKHHFWKRLIVLSLMFYLSCNSTYMHELNIGLKDLFAFALIYYLAFFNGRNWSDPLLFIFGIFSTSHLLFGQDQVWGQSFSIFRAKHLLSNLEYSLIFLIALGYMRSRKFLSSAVDN